MKSNNSQAPLDHLDLPVEFVEELWPGTVISSPRTRRTPPVSQTPSRTDPSPTALEVLNSAFMFLSGLARRKRSKISPAA
jgi:hypothetical protein